MNLRDGKNVNLKAELTRFWRRCNRTDYTEKYRMERLKLFSNIVIRKTEPRARRFRREQFANGGCRLGTICFTCPKRARVRHHIIQLRNGGNNTRDNIVPLCPDCHAEIHPWLEKDAAKQAVNNSSVTIQQPAICEQPPKLLPEFPICSQDIHLAEPEETSELIHRQVGEGIYKEKELLTECVNNPIEFELIPRCPESKRFR